MTHDNPQQPTIRIRIVYQDLPENYRPEEVSRFSMEIPTELGLVERFARELATLASTLQGEAILPGVV
ncbi:MAG: hypothetical protein JXB10_18750 [Pirellulales bacterium]|nr:hypothetical protein [Pirellulales bacterium]